MTRIAAGLLLYLLASISVASNEPTRAIRIVEAESIGMLVEVDGDLLGFDAAEARFNEAPDRWPREMTLQVLFEPEATLESVHDTALIFRFMGFRDVQMYFRVPGSTNLRAIALPDVDVMVADEARTTDSVCPASASLRVGHPYPPSGSAAGGREPPDDGDYRLASVGFTSGHPRERAILAPGEPEERDGRRRVDYGGGADLWAVCTYQSKDASFTAWRRLGDRARCRVEHDDASVRATCEPARS